MIRAAPSVAVETGAINHKHPRRLPRITQLVVFLLMIVVAGGWLAALPGQARAQGSTVLVTRIDGAITPVIADHLVDGAAAAERDGHAAYLVELDTPGGLDTSMREIVKAFLGADVPVVMYVTPSGARAASAGAIITFAAHIAAMAPGTTIGAATPVDLQDGEISDKVINDAAAFAESVAAQRDRNTEFAVDTVREGRAVPAAEAVRLDAVDLLASDRAELLRELDGRSVKVASGNTVTLRTAGATTVEQDFGLFRRLLQLLADPNLAFLFLSLGTLAIIYELANPGIGFGGIAGAILLAPGVLRPVGAAHQPGRRAAAGAGRGTVRGRAVRPWGGGVRRRRYRRPHPGRACSCSTARSVSTRPWWCRRRWSSGAGRCWPAGWPGGHAGPPASAAGKGCWGARSPCGPPTAPAARSSWTAPGGPSAAAAAP